MLVLACFCPGVKPIWFFDVFYYFEGVLFSLPCLLIPFMSFLNDFLKSSYMTTIGKDGGR